MLRRKLRRERAIQIRQRTNRAQLCAVNGMNLKKQQQLDPCIGLADAGCFASTGGPGQPGLAQMALLAAVDDAFRAALPRWQPGADASPCKAQLPQTGYSQARRSFPGAARSLAAGATTPGGPSLARCKVLPPYATCVDGRAATVPRLPAA